MAEIEIHNVFYPTGQIARGIIRGIRVAVNAADYRGAKWRFSLALYILRLAVLVGGMGGVDVDNDRGDRK